MATLVSYALTDLASVKETLSISAGTTTHDNLIIRYINMATEIIEGYCRRRFKLTVYTNEEYDGTGTDELILRNRPVTTLTTLSVRDTSLNQDDFTTIDTQDYFLDSQAGIVTGVGRFYGGNARWRVTYTAGYDIIPADIAEACALLAAYLSGQAINGSAASLGSVTRMKEGNREISYGNLNNNSTTYSSGNTLLDQLGLSGILDRYTGVIISGGR